MTEADKQTVVHDLSRASEEFERWHDATVSALQERAGQLRAQAGRLAGLREAADQLGRVGEQLKEAVAEAEAKRAEAESLRQELAARQSELAEMEEMRGQLAEKEEMAGELTALRAALAEKDTQLSELETLRTALAEQRTQLEELEALRAALVSQNAHLDEMDALRAALELEEQAHARADLEKKMLLDQIEGLKLAAGEADELRSRVERLEKELESERTAVLRLQAQSAARVEVRPAAQAPAAPVQPAVPLRPAAEPENALQKVLKSRSRGPRRQLGEILITSGVLTQDQVDEAIRIQVSDPRRRLGTIIVDLGFATEEIIAATLAAQLRTRFVDNLEREMTPEAMRVVPQNLAIHHRCVPLAFGGGTLSVAMANPLDLIAIEDLQHATGAFVEPVVATASAIDRVLNKYYMKTKSSGFTTR